MLLADLARGAPLRDGGQDRVGVLAPARPEAQHGLLDGAVGVASLHARWTEMEGKLRAVEANLLRAGDRWRAMDAQLDGLGRQAERDRVRSTRTTDVE